MTETLKTRLAGALGLLLIIAAVGTTLGVYQKTFVSSVDVTLHADRAGLLMDRGAKVRINGMPVGEVRQVRVGSDGGAVLELAIDPEAAELIPAGIRADITPTTVFGAKYVDLLFPTKVQPGFASIANGDTIRGGEVTVEANDVFGTVQEILTTVDPSDLNRTLSAMATALEGRGDELGDYLSRVNRYVGELNGSTDHLVADFEQGAQVSDLYADLAPSLVDIVEQGAVTAATLDEKSGSLQALLVDFTEAADTGRGFLGRLDSPLIAALDVLRPVLASLEKFSPEFTCVLEALVKHRDAVNSVLGADEPGIQGMVSLLPASPGYKFPDNLPKLIPNAQPDCLSLPEMDLAHPPVRDFDDGSPGPDGSVGLDLTAPPAQLYLGLVEDWFGQTGLSLLLDNLMPGGGTR
ncbi:MAG TPA: MCE family protein [Nocardioides sp.]